MNDDNVIPFKPAPVKGLAPTPSPPIENKRYACQAPSCGSQKFLLTTEGEVWCACCYVLIGNLKVMVVR